MKFRTNSFRNNGTNDRPHDSSVSSGTNHTPSLASGGWMLAIGGAALCLCLGSCLPYDGYGYGGGSATYTTYQPGYRVTSLPSGYRSETIAGSTYYFHNGNYYRRASGGYVVTDAPRTSRYYDEYGRIRQATPRERGYEQAYDSHDRRYDRGDVITRLPDGYRVVNHRGKQYYQAGERYYIRDNDTYAVVSRPY